MSCQQPFLLPVADTAALGRTTQASVLFWHKDFGLRELAGLWWKPNLTLLNSRSDSVSLVQGGHGATRLATYLGVCMLRAPAQARSSASDKGTEADQPVSCLRSRHSATGAVHAQPLSPLIQAMPCSAR